MSIIQVEDVSMRFNLAQEKTETLKEYTVKLLKHQLFFNEFYALRDISFKIEPGPSTTSASTWPPASSSASWAATAAARARC